MSSSILDLDKVSLDPFLSNDRFPGKWMSLTFFIKS